MKLSTRYFAAFAALATTALIAIGAVDSVVTYRQGVAHVGELQRAQVHIASTRVAAYLDTLAMQLTEVNALPWSGRVLGSDDLRNELHRLLKLNPAFHELRVVDASGRVTMGVSRVALDSKDGSGSWPLQDAYVREGRRHRWYGPVYFLEGSTPHVTLAIRDAAVPAADLLVAEIDLRYITDLIAAMRLGEGARVFLVDGTNHLIAHPNLSLLHRKVSLDAFPQVIAAREERSGGASRTREAVSPETGQDVLTSAALIGTPEWITFVEQPLAEIMAPVWAMVYRTAAVLLVLLALAVLVSRWLATKLTRPIVALERGAARITAGDLGVRVDIATGDEVEALASEFNRMAESVGRSHAELEALVEVRTRELGEAHRQVRRQADALAAVNRELELRLKELAVKKDEAERANAAKTRFLAAASHDLRQPMQAISLLIEVLRERITGGDLRILTDKVQRSVHALETLFVSLLDISRLDAGAVRPHWQDFAMQPLLASVQANFLPQALAKGLQLRIMGSTAAVHSDAALLERILGNLVSNAIRYTSRGRVTVGCRRHGDALRVLVVDTGPGIPEQFHQEVFEEFFQVSNAERDRSKGLGLGLSIVKRTAEILGHRLIMRSYPGRGSLFGIEVPLANIEPAPPQGALATQAHDRLAGLFVVVIDDDCENRFAVEALCTQWGCHVLGAARTTDALAELQGHLRTPDLIITDFRLGQGATGKDAILHIRAMAEDDVPAIIVTGDMAVHEADTALCRPCALLYKPINAEQLWSAAELLLSVERLQGAGHAP